MRKIFSIISEVTILGNIAAFNAANEAIWCSRKISSRAMAYAAASMVLAALFKEVFNQIYIDQFNQRCNSKKKGLDLNTQDFLTQYTVFCCTQLDRLEIKKKTTETVMNLLPLAIPFALSFDCMKGVRTALLINKKDLRDIEAGIVAATEVRYLWKAIKFVTGSGNQGHGDRDRQGSQYQYQGNPLMSFVNQYSSGNNLSEF